MAITLPSSGGLDGTRDRRVALQGLVATDVMIVGEVLREGSLQVPFAESDDVVDAVAANRADQAFAVSVLPR